MKIKEYIKGILLSNQGVIISGLGGFVSEYEPAAFDIAENKFLPPSKKITFNPEYSYKDNLLGEFIAKKEKIDITEAQKHIEDFVNDAIYKLKKGEQIDFPEIGLLKQNSKGQYIFTQYKESNLLTDSFGLTSVKAKQSITPKPQAKVKKSYKKAIIISSCAALFIMICTFSWYLTNGFSDFSILKLGEKNNYTSEGHFGGEHAEENLDSIARADSLKARIVSAIDDNTDKKDALFYQEPDKSNLSVADEEQKPAYSEFHIIAGSFKRMENAEKFSTELKVKGYEPQIIQSNENLFRIAIYTYKSEAEALKKLYKLRETSEIKSVWILKAT